MAAILSDEVARYLDELAELAEVHPVVVEMEERARQERFPIVRRAVGRLLELEARAVGARRVMELGSGFGYSAYWFARAVGPEGSVTCTDGDPANARAAEDYLSRAGLWDRVSYRVGDALDGLAAEDGEFDVVYNDVDKDGYPDCWRAARDRVRLGGLYLCDNVLWYGRVATGEPSPDHPGYTEAVVEHNRLVAEDPRYLWSISPIRDGLLIALRVT